MVIKNLENKIRLVGIICTAFLVGCVIISLSSIWTARTMVSDAQKKVYVLDGDVLYVEYNKDSDMLDVGQPTNAGLVAQHRFPYDHNIGLDANLQAVNEKLNELEEYRAELQEAEYSVGMRR